MPVFRPNVRSHKWVCVEGWGALSPHPTASSVEWSWQCMMPVIRWLCLTLLSAWTGSSQIILWSIKASTRHALKFISVCLSLKIVCAVCLLTRQLLAGPNLRARRAPKPWPVCKCSFKQSFSLWLEIFFFFFFAPEHRCHGLRSAFLGGKCDFLAPTHRMGYGLLLEFVSCITLFEERL